VYASAAVDAAPDGPPVDDPRTPTGRLGVRAAHLWVARGKDRISLHDVLGGSFVLLTAGEDGGAWARAAADAAARLGITLPAYRVGPDGDLVCPAGEFETAYGTVPGGAVLIRPDGVLAWRSVPDADPAAALEPALRRLLARDG